MTASNDRIEENETLFESFEGAWWSKTEKRKYLTAGNGTATTLEVTRKRLTGFPTGRQAETQSTDANGNVTIATVDVDRAGRIVVRGTNRVGIANKQVETLVNGLPVRALDVNGLLTTTQYDGLMRVAAVIDSRGNSTRTAYYSGSTLKQSVTDAANHTVATFGYDTSGRVVWQADALGHATRSSYTLRGKLHRTWGGGAYPVEYGFDATYGDRVSQSTFRGGTGWDGATWPGSPGTADTTTWTFDAPSGLNTVKTDAMGRDERYSFNIRGQLETREWARLVTIGPSTGQRVKATYTYSGTTGEQTSIAYNDGLTTNLTYTYLRSGLPQTITDRTGTRTLDYHLPSATLISETLDNTYFGGRKILYKRESQATGVLGRPVGYKLGTSALPSMDQEITYGYENLDRLTTVSVGTANASTWRTHRYSYRADSNLIETLVVDNTPFVVTRTYEDDRNLLTSIETKSTSPNTVYTKFSYTYDARRYRSTALQEGTAFADYGDATYRQFAYNGRGELTSGIGYLGSNVASQGAPLPGRRYEYAYDTIGNRQWSNSTGVSTLRDDYSVNALNQYISRENNTVSISGTAATDAVVAVKGRNVTAGRQGRFWSDEVTVPNVLGPWAGPLSVYANKSVGGSSVMRIDSRSAAIPAVAQSLTYDLDGNTLSDGLWDYQWDAENRLVRLETTVAARSGGIAHRIINFTYDYLGRRVQKQVIDGLMVTELSSARFIYNGWDIIAEYSVLNGSTLDKLQRTYAWGVDIAGSLADAGGVGALLQFVNSVTGTAYLPSFDGNGNVASLINLGTGALAAAYEYSPYGEMLRDEIHDNAAAPFAFKFSTKWRDAETSWLNYGRRYYDPRNGRFIGRDPIAEEGGINLYAFCGNNPVDRWDRLGMDTMYYDGSGGYSGGRKGISDNSFMNLLRNYTDQDYPEGIDAGASFGRVGMKVIGGNRTVFTIVVMNSNGTSTHVPVSRDQLARADRLSLASVLATGVTVAAGANGPGRADVAIGPLQPYTGPNEGAFYIPVPEDAPNSIAGAVNQAIASGILLASNTDGMFSDGSIPWVHNGGEAAAAGKAGPISVTSSLFSTPAFVPMLTCMDCHGLDWRIRAAIGLPMDQPWFNQQGTEAATKLFLGTVAVGGTVGVGMATAPETTVWILKALLDVWTSNDQRFPTTPLDPPVETPWSPPSVPTGPASPPPPPPPAYP